MEWKLQSYRLRLLGLVGYALDSFERFRLEFFRISWRFAEIGRNTHTERRMEKGRKKGETETGEGRELGKSNHELVALHKNVPKWLWRTHLVCNIQMAPLTYIIIVTNPNFSYKNAPFHKLRSFPCDWQHTLENVLHCRLDFCAPCTILPLRFCSSHDGFSFS